VTFSAIPELLTVDEVAGVLRTSRKAVCAMIQRRHLPGCVESDVVAPFRARNYYTGSTTLRLVAKGVSDERKDTAIRVREVGKWTSGSANQTAPSSGNGSRARGHPAPPPFGGEIRHLPFPASKPPETPDRMTHSPSRVVLSIRPTSIRASSLSVTASLLVARTSPSP
jgi:hypothetical protein